MLRPSCLAMIVIWLAAMMESPGEDRFNVLFIAVDDLRPELGCYGHPQVRSPHLDRLAASGTTFTRAYCQQAVCNPSRASIMTGLRPETLGVLDLPTFFRQNLPDVVTIAQLFRQNGYHSQGIGKIYHLGHGNQDDPASWSVMEKFNRAPRYGPEGEAHLRRVLDEARKRGVDLQDRNSRPRGLPWEAPEVPDEALTDGMVAKHAVDLLRRLRDEPFFLAVGFVNPHLPFVAPKRYWDLYERSSIPLPPNSSPPEDSPEFAHTSWGELRKYDGMPAKGPVSEEQARALIHGYWAAVSYVDALVGKMLDELDTLGLREKTIVVVWGDHGWQLGDHGFWCKHTNYEVAARVPLIVSAPSQKAAGTESRALTELVDVYPTLAELCGLEGVPVDLAGRSLRPLLDDPSAPWKEAAFHVYPRGGRIGRAIRTDQYRLVEWDWRKGDHDPVYELYNLEEDPRETRNLAKLPEMSPVLKRLSSQLRAGSGPRSSQAFE